MPKKSMRGIAPGRARDANSRSGSFERYHSKRGGRQPGTRNAFSCDYKNTIFEAAHRIGYDGNGKNGLVGYFMWLAVFHPKAFSLLLEHVVPLRGLGDLAVSRAAPNDGPDERTSSDFLQPGKCFLEAGGASPRKDQGKLIGRLDRPRFSALITDAHCRRKSGRLLQVDGRRVSAQAWQEAAIKATELVSRSWPN